MPGEDRRTSPTVPGGSTDVVGDRRHPDRRDSRTPAPRRLRNVLCEVRAALLGRRGARSSEKNPSVPLFSRLLISHMAPSMVLTFALGLILTALVRLTMMLGQLNEQELGDLGTDGKLHSVAWELEVTMRHGYDSCSRDAVGAGGRTREAMTFRVEQLRGALNQHARASQGLRRVSERYAELGDTVLASEVCAALVSPEVQRERAQLDEEITNHWVDRLGELSAALQQKDDEARTLGKLASFGGITLTAVAFLASLLLARRLAREVGGPLGDLSALARRVGRGDLHGRVEVDGPAEVVTLAEELERMRERLLQLEALKQGFLASVSHELRTPLSKIREALALLSDGAVGKLEERQARVVQIARTACEREIRMVTTLLDFSRLRAGAPLRFRTGHEARRAGQERRRRRGGRGRGRAQRARGPRDPGRAPGDDPRRRARGARDREPRAQRGRRVEGEAARARESRSAGGRAGRQAGALGAHLGPRSGARRAGGPARHDLRCVRHAGRAEVAQGDRGGPRAGPGARGGPGARRRSGAGRERPGGAVFNLWVPFDKSAPSRMATTAPSAIFALAAR